MTVKLAERSPFGCILLVKASLCEVYGHGATSPLLTLRYVLGAHATRMRICLFLDKELTIRYLSLETGLILNMSYQFSIACRGRGGAFGSLSEKTFQREPRVN